MSLTGRYNDLLNEPGKDLNRRPALANREGEPTHASYFYAILSVSHTSPLDIFPVGVVCDFIDRDSP